MTRPEPVAALIDAYIAGRSGLTGLDLYYALERATALLEYHSMFRPGARNRTHDGLQQSYGDHNRLLMLGLDRLLGGDVGWLEAHTDGDAAPTPLELTECAMRAANLMLPRPALVAIWLGAALHDCGIVNERGARVDVEDGVVLSANVLDRLCPREYRALATFALRYHDYIKDAYVGEMPIAPIAAAAGALGAQRAMGLAALGLIQVAGAASLGTGRLSAFRITIFGHCFDGDALDDQSAPTRLVRLGASPNAPTVAPLAALIANVGIHGWQQASVGAEAKQRDRALDWLADRNQQWRAAHIVIAGDHRGPDLVAGLEVARVAVDTALSGQRIATLT